MEPLHILLLVAAYFLVLIGISYLTGKNDDNDTFFLGNKQSPWHVVAFGMVGASLSGVTFISVPGWVATSQFSYMQMVLGYLVGYFVIATVLLPLYYRLNLTSIYSYLDDRFGKSSYKTGSAFFLLSRTIGASFRLFLVANVLQIMIFDAMNIPFWLTVVFTILLIWLYTFRSGIKTIIWTDTLQTLFMLIAVGVAIVMIKDGLNFSWTETVNAIAESEYSRIFFFDDPSDKKFFIKQFFAGAFIAIVMTGLDQDMMQKNLSCKNIKEAQKNMFWFSIVLVFVNLIFLGLGALLYIYGAKMGISAVGDDLFASIAMDGGLGTALSLFFVLGLIAAAYSSADSALTSLTTAFCVDFLQIEGREKSTQKGLRKKTHIAFSALLIVVILIFHAINDQSVISALFKVAGFTYGPLLGLYAFGLFTKWEVKDKLVPLICIAAPLICYGLNNYFTIGFELLIYNGALTFLGLMLIRERKVA
ncbi:MAG: SSS family solute:Na+ symporter [Flavobacteriales bacterium]|jgi:SSS family solute:Na+ symporter